MHSMIYEIDGKSNRYNNNKIVYTNLPPCLLNELYSEEFINELPFIGLNRLAEHYTLAGKKYPNAEAQNGFTFPNWAKGQLFESFVIDSMYRHLMAYYNGEINDPDFGSHHMISVAWGAAALFHFFSFYEHYQIFDDRKWVGFDLKNTYLEVTSENLHTLPMHNLNFIQTSTDVNEIIEAVYQLFLAALYLAEKDFDNNKISYTVDENRLNKIIHTEYGIPKQAAETGK